MKKSIKTICCLFIASTYLFSLGGCKNNGMQCVCGNNDYVWATYDYESLEYKMLEDYLREADQIIYATYSGQREEFYIHKSKKSKEKCLKRDTESYIIFENPSIKGESTFKVHIINSRLSVKNRDGEIVENLFVSQSNNLWEKGKTYILLVKELDTGENDGIKRYTMIGDAVIPADGGEATLYSEPIENHSTGYNGEGSVEEYIKEFINNNAE